MPPKEFRNEHELWGKGEIERKKRKKEDLLPF
jgi:hypothetical protein